MSLGPSTKFDRVEDKSHTSKKLGWERGVEAGPRESDEETREWFVLFGLRLEPCRWKKKQPVELSSNL